jgi:hypothetical protein
MIFIKWLTFCNIGPKHHKPMESINKSSLKTKEEVISDLKEILQLVNDGKEGYQSAADATDSAELKALF